MEKIDLGNYNIATSWDEVTLEMWEKYVRKASEAENNSVDVITTLECFSNIPRDVIHQIPTDLFEKILLNLQFAKDEPQSEPSNKIVIDGEEYIVNTMEKLKVKEYLDLQTVIENDKFNYTYMLAILCRKKGEEYNEEYIADKISKRAEMFSKASINKIMPILAFFLSLWAIYEIHSQNSLMVSNIKSEAIELVRSIKSSRKRGVFTTLLHPQETMRLRKLEKYIKSL